MRKLIAVVTTLACMNVSAQGPLKDDKEVARYIQAMKLLGTDGSISFSSSWKKKNWFNSTAGQVDEVQEIAKQYQSQFENKIMESKLSIEEKDVCEQFVVYKTEEEKYNYSTSTTSSNRNLKVGLSTAAAAAAAGLVGLGGIIGSGGLGIAGLASASGAVGGFFQGDFNYKSQQAKSTTDVDYYYVRNGITCGKLGRYSRAVIKLTPDVFSLHPQQSAELIYNNVGDKLDSLSKLTTTLHQSVTNIIDNPVYDVDRFIDNFSAFFVTKLIIQNQISLEAGLDILAKDFQENISYVQTTLKSLKANAFIVENYSDRIDEIESKLNELKSFLASLENSTLALSVNGQKRILLNSNQILRLNGTKLSSEIKNYSILFPSIESVLNTLLEKDVLVEGSSEVHSYLSRFKRIDFLENTKEDLMELGFSERSFPAIYESYYGGFEVKNSPVFFGKIDTIEGARREAAYNKRNGFGFSDTVDFQKYMEDKGCILSSVEREQLNYLCPSEKLKSITLKNLYSK